MCPKKQCTYYICIVPSFKLCAKTSPWCCHGLHFVQRDNHQLYAHTQSLRRVWSGFGEISEKTKGGVAKERHRQRKRDRERMQAPITIFVNCLIRDEGPILSSGQVFTMVQVTRHANHSIKCHTTLLFVSLLGFFFYYSSTSCGRRRNSRWWQANAWVKVELQSLDLDPLDSVLFRFFDYFCLLWILPPSINWFGITRFYVKVVNSIQHTFFNLIMST